MFSIPGKQAVTMTPRAASQIARMMQRDGRQGLRVGVKKGGCAGMEYTMEWADTVNPLDELGERIAKRYRLICFDAGFTLIEPIRTTAATLARLTRERSAEPSPFGPVSTTRPDHSWPKRIG